MHKENTEMEGTLTNTQSQQQNSTNLPEIIRKQTKSVMNMESLQDVIDKYDLMDANGIPHHVIREYTLF